VPERESVKDPSLPTPLSMFRQSTFHMMEWYIKKATHVKNYMSRYDEPSVQNIVSYFFG